MAKISRRDTLAFGAGALALGVFSRTNAQSARYVRWDLTKPNYGAIGVELKWARGAAPLTSTTVKNATTEAIARARNFFSVRENDGATLSLFFPSGRYVFGTRSETGYAMTINNFEPGRTGRLIVQGAGRDKTKFVVANNQNQFGNGSQWGIFARNSKRIIFRDFHLTVPQQTVTQGNVIRTGTNFVDLRIHTSFPDSTLLLADRQNAAGRYLRRYFNRDNPRIDTRFEQVAWTDTWRTRDAGRVFRFRLPPAEPSWQFAQGNLIGVKAKAGGQTYRFIDCHDVRWLSIRLSRKTRGLFLRCTDTLIRDLLIQREYVNGRPACLASPGGGPQFHGRQGGIVSPNECANSVLVSGTRIINSTIVGTGDDCIGFFEQDAPYVGGCTLQDSFARGIFAHRCNIVRQSDNYVERAPYVFEDPCR